MLLCIQAYPQLKNFGSQARFKPGPNYQYAVYGYYDIIREFGLGFQQQLNNSFCLDYSVYRVYPLGPVSKPEWGYYDFRGFGLALKTKYEFSKLNRLYVGANVAFETLQHHAQWIESYYDNEGKKDMGTYKDLVKRKGYGFNFGVTFGNKLALGQVLVEPFITAGLFCGQVSATTYTTTYNTGFSYATNYSQKYPNSSSGTAVFFHSNAGIKIGFMYRRSVKQAAIDEVFDKVYIPRFNKLNAYISTLDRRHLPVPKEKRKYLYRAIDLTADANRNLLRKYRRCYEDTTWLYSEVDAYFELIDAYIRKAYE